MRAVQELRRGGNPVDCTLYGKERYEISSEYLEAGDKVKVFITGENTTDKFRAGPINENGSTTSVGSSGGEISNTFTISTSGEYSIYIEGTTSATVSITGSIIIQ